jgi:hypothetical protein
MQTKSQKSTSLKGFEGEESFEYDCDINLLLTNNK